MLKPLTEIAKSFAFTHTKLGVPRYPYGLEPIQLATLVMELDRLGKVAGNLVEVGVARGMTTRFLAQHIQCQHLENSLLYYAIDTFDSFTDSDLKYEVERRGKPLLDLHTFSYNNFEIWKANFTAFPFVKAVKSDCSIFDYATIAPIKLSLLDVDLYLPTKRTLPKLYEATVGGGVILVDDVRSHVTYDGVYYAYMEFCAERGLAPKVIGNKCGVIYKPHELLH